MKPCRLQLFILFFILLRRNLAFFKRNVLVVVVVLASACSLHAQVLSGSFEGDPNMLWDPSGPWYPSGVFPEIVSTFSVQDKESVWITIQPVDGNSFVLLKTGGGTAETDYSQLTQIIDVNDGDTLSGVYFFSTNDWMPSWNDAGNIYLSLYDPCFPGPNPPQFRSPAPTKYDHFYYNVEIPLAYQDVNSIVVFGGRAGGAMADWKQFSYTFKPGEGGTYRLVLRVADAIDHAFQSTLAVDALTITAGPPEPWCNFKLAGDINRDCKVDLVDFAMMAENWLIDCNITPENPSCISL